MEWEYMRTESNGVELVCRTDAEDEIERLTAERDRLATENAELRARAARWKRIARLEFRKFRDWKEYGEGRRAELAAANATLDALREAVPEDAYNTRRYKPADCFGFLLAATAILYPQPAALAKEKTNGN